MNGKVYNPLQKENLGKSVADALLKVDVRPLSDTSELSGAGVYAIYYTGDFDFYRSIAQANANQNFSQPIYVGKAIPAGGRKGGVSFDSENGRAMRERLRNHAKSIAEATNLELADFYFRSLVVDDIWIPLGENVLIDRYRPIWNLVIDGFGNKDPGNRRSAQHLSPWDVLHPGRSFATKLALGDITVESVKERLERFFSAGLLPVLDSNPESLDGDVT
jgi:hypothetical protein